MNKHLQTLQKIYNDVKFGLTLKVALGAEVAYAESENAKSVELAEDVLLERK